MITADGGRRLPDDEVAAVADRVIDARMTPTRRPGRGPDLSVRSALAMSMPFYVSPEQLMKDRADFARKGIARGRSVVVVQYADGVLFVSENPSQALHKVSEIYDRIALRRGRPLQRVREPPDRRRPAGRHARLRLRPPRRHRARAGQRVRPDARHDLLLGRREAVRGRAVRRRDRRAGPRRPDLPAHLRRPGGRRARLRGDGRRRRHGRGVLQGAVRRGRLAGGRAPHRRRRPGPTSNERGSPTTG